MLSGKGNAALAGLTVNDPASGQSGGSLSTANEYVGNGGTGSFAHSAGSNSLSGNLYLGYNSADSGSYTLSGTGALSAGNAYVGYSGTGTFNQSAGTSSLTGYNQGELYLGYNTGASGAYNLSGGQLSASYQYIGNSGTGSFTQSGGTSTTAGYLYLGNNTTGSGTYALSGTARLFDFPNARGLQQSHGV